MFAFIVPSLSLRYNRDCHLDNGRLDGAIVPTVHPQHPECAISLEEAIAPCNLEHKLFFDSFLFKR